MRAKVPKRSRSRILAPRLLCPTISRQRSMPASSARDVLDAQVKLMRSMMSQQTDSGSLLATSRTTGLASSRRSRNAGMGRSDVDPLQPAAVFSASDRSTSELDVRSHRRESQRRRQGSFDRGQHRPQEDRGGTAAPEDRVLTLATHRSQRRSSQRTTGRSWPNALRGAAGICTASTVSTRCASSGDGRVVCPGAGTPGLPGSTCTRLASTCPERPAGSRRNVWRPTGSSACRSGPPLFAAPGRRFQPERSGQAGAGATERRGAPRAHVRLGAPQVTMPILEIVNSWSGRSMAGPLLLDAGAAVTSRSRTPPRAFECPCCGPDSGGRRFRRRRRSSGRTGTP